MHCRCGKMRQMLLQPSWQLLVQERSRERRLAWATTQAIQVSTIHVSYHLMYCNSNSLKVRQARETISARVQREASARHATAFCLLPA